jgi:hypothetical protein
MDRSGINLNSGLQKDRWLITLLASICPNFSLLSLSWQSLRYFYAAICPYFLSSEDNQSRHLKIIIHKIICNVPLVHYYTSATHGLVATFLLTLKGTGSRERIQDKNSVTRYRFIQESLLVYKFSNSPVMRCRHCHFPRGLGENISEK